MLGTVGSLCSGIGGADLGLQSLGLDIRWQVELDSYRRAVLEQRFPGRRRLADVRDLALASTLEPVDLVHAEVQRAEAQYVDPVLNWLVAIHPRCAVLTFAASAGMPAALCGAVTARLTAAGYQSSAAVVRSYTVVEHGEDHVGSAGRSLFCILAALDGAVPTLPIVTLPLAAFAWERGPSPASGYLEPADVDAWLDETTADPVTLAYVRGFPRGWTCACGTGPCTCDPAVCHLALREATAPSLAAWLARTLLP